MITGQTREVANTRLQGERQTYFAGEAMNFPTVETVCQYSRYLVETFF